MENDDSQPFESEDIGEALNMAERGEGGRRFRVFWDQVHLCAQMARDTVRGDYDLGWREKATLIAGLAYVASPLDAVPDAVPVAGFADDAIVIGAVVVALGLEIADYRRWRHYGEGGTDPNNTASAA